MDLISKELQLLEEGKVYEFAQTLLHKCRRLVMRSKAEEALQISIAAIKVLLERGERENSIELLSVILEASKTAPVPAEEVEHIVGFLPSPKDSEFLQQLTKNRADPVLFALLARVKEDEGHTAESMVSHMQACWIHADKFQETLRTLQILIDRGFPGEEDLFVCRTTLLLLALKKLAMVKELLKEFALLDTPLMNFARFAAAAVEAGELSLLQVGKEKYTPSLNRDPDLFKYLSKVEATLA